MVRGVKYINLERCQPKHPLRVRVNVTGEVGVWGMVRKLGLWLWI